MHTAKVNPEVIGCFYHQMVVYSAMSSSTGFYYGFLKDIFFGGEMAVDIISLYQGNHKIPLQSSTREQ